MNSRRLMVPQVECLNPSTGVVVGKIDAVKVAKAIGDIPQNVNFAVSLGTLQFFPEAGTGLPEGAMALGLVSSYSRTSPKADNQRRAQCAITGRSREPQLVRIGNRLCAAVCKTPMILFGLQPGQTAPRGNHGNCAQILARSCATRLIKAADHTGYRLVTRDC
jgi:hypothetical protein